MCDHSPSLKGQRTIVTTVRGQKVKEQGYKVM